jgi:chromosome segregation ATPase
MNRSISSSVLAVVVVAGAASAASVVGRAQGAAPQIDVLGALLTEVRSLRVAMEQMASAGPRVQLALGRLQLQEQRVTTIIRRLETTRSAIAEAERQLEQNRQQLKVFESAVPDTAEAKQLEHMTEQFKSALAVVTANLQRLQADEAGILQELTAEQSRWSDINRRVEELERALDGR